MCFPFPLNFTLSFSLSRSFCPPFCFSFSFSLSFSFILEVTSSISLSLSLSSLIAAPFFLYGPRTFFPVTIGLFFASLTLPDISSLADADSDWDTIGFSRVIIGWFEGASRRLFRPVEFSDIFRTECAMLNCGKEFLASSAFLAALSLSLSLSFALSSIVSGQGMGAAASCCTILLFGFGFRGSETDVACAEQNICHSMLSSSSFMTLFVKPLGLCNTHQGWAAMRHLPCLHSTHAPFPEHNAHFSRNLFLSNLLIVIADVFFVSTKYISGIHDAHSECIHFPGLSRALYAPPVLEHISQTVFWTSSPAAQTSQNLNSGSAIRNYKLALVEILMLSSEELLFLPCIIGDVSHTVASLMNSHVTFFTKYYLVGLVDIWIQTNCAGLILQLIISVLFIS